MLARPVLDRLQKVVPDCIFDMIQIRFQASGA